MRGKLSACAKSAAEFKPECEEAGTIALRQIVVRPELGPYAQSHPTRTQSFDPALLRPSLSAQPQAFGTDRRNACTAPGATWVVFFDNLKTLPASSVPRRKKKRRVKCRAALLRRTEVRRPGLRRIGRKAGKASKNRDRSTVPFDSMVRFDADNAPNRRPPRWQSWDNPVNIH